MPIYEQGYKHWTGVLKGHATRWLAISRQGIVLSWKNKQLKRLIMIAWLPLLYYGLVFFIIGYLTDPANLAGNKFGDSWQYRLFRNMFGSDIIQTVINDPAAIRLPLWSLLFYFFFYYTQSFLVMLVVALVGPKLISDDLRYNALQIYFSKPITKLDYLLGKFGVIAFYVGMVTFAPALVLYIVSILFSPSLSVISQTWAILPKIFFTSLIIIIPCGVIMLALSSLTRNSRFLGIGWVLFWVISMGVSSFINETVFEREINHNYYYRSYNDEDRDKALEEMYKKERWSELLSFRTNITSLAFQAFAVEKEMKPFVENNFQLKRFLYRVKYHHRWGYSLLILFVLTVISIFILHRRIRSPEGL